MQRPNPLPISLLLVIFLAISAMSCRGSDPIVGKWGAGTANYVEFRSDGRIGSDDSKMNWRRIDPTQIVITSSDPKSPSHNEMKVHADVSNDRETLFLNIESPEKASNEDKRTASLKAFHGSDEEWDRANKPYTPEGRKERLDLSFNAYQIRTSIGTFCGDNNNTLPTKADDLITYMGEHKIDPNFKITLPGKKIADLADPAKTECAVIEGKIWKVVFYADFHSDVVVK